MRQPAQRLKRGRAGGTEIPRMLTRKDKEAVRYRAAIEIHGIATRSGRCRNKARPGNSLSLHLISG
jgi:hypothetical protein